VARESEGRVRHYGNQTRKPKHSGYERHQAVYRRGVPTTEEDNGG